MYLLACLDILIFTICSYEIIYADYRPMEFYIIYCLGTLLPAVAAFSLLLISGQTNTARYLYYIFWIIRYAVIFLTGLDELLHPCGLVKSICASVIDVPKESITEESCESVKCYLTAAWIVFSVFGIHVLIVLRTYVHDGGLNEIELVSPERVKVRRHSRLNLSSEYSSKSKIEES